MIVSTSYIKRIVASVMLAAFALVLSPKELWHHCGTWGHHHSHAHHDDDSHASITPVDDCAICDFQLLPAPFAISEDFQSKTEVYSHTSFHIGDRVFPGAYFSRSGRGPPSFC